MSTLAALSPSETIISNQERLSKLAQVCGGLDSGLAHAVRACEERTLYLRSLSSYLNLFFNKACKYRALASECKQAIDAEIKLLEHKVARYKSTKSFEGSFRALLGEALRLRKQLKEPIGVSEAEEFRVECLKTLFKRFEANNPSLVELMSLEVKAAQLEDKQLVGIAPKLKLFLEQDSPEFYLEQGVDPSRFNTQPLNPSTPPIPKVLALSTPQPANPSKPHPVNPSTLKPAPAPTPNFDILDSLVIKNDHNETEEIQDKSTHKDPSTPQPLNPSQLLSSPPKPKSETPLFEIDILDLAPGFSISSNPNAPPMNNDSTVFNFFDPSPKVLESLSTSIAPRPTLIPQLSDEPSLSIKRPLNSSTFKVKATPAKDPSILPPKEVTPLHPNGLMSSTPAKASDYDVLNFLDPTPQPLNAPTPQPFNSLNPSTAQPLNASTSLNKSNDISLPNPAEPISPPNLTSSTPISIPISSSLSQIAPNRSKLSLYSHSKPQVNESLNTISRIRNSAGTANPHNDIRLRLRATLQSNADTL